MGWEWRCFAPLPVSPDACGSLPPLVHSPCDQGCECRDDDYLILPYPETGIKLRGSTSSAPRLELKTRTAVRSRGAERWSKVVFGPNCEPDPLRLAKDVHSTAFPHTWARISKLRSCARLESGVTVEQTDVVVQRYSGMARRGELQPDTLIGRPFRYRSWAFEGADPETLGKSVGQWLGLQWRGDGEYTSSSHDCGWRTAVRERLCPGDPGKALIGGYPELLRRTCSTEMACSKEAVLSRPDKDVGFQHP
jgi:hypothetical protein